MKSQLPFIFGYEIALSFTDTHVSIPANITNKQALLSGIATKLKFPDYFGENWDALDECLHDLSWLPPGQVILQHADLPLAHDVANARIYVAVLADAARKMSGEQRRLLLIVFPIELRDQISWLLRLT